MNTRTGLAPRTLPVHLIIFELHKSVNLYYNLVEGFDRY